MMFATADSPVASRFVRPTTRRATDRFMLKSEGSFVFLPYTEVNWIEAQGDYVKFHAGARSCLVRMTMKALEVNLEPERFLRVHRSAAVNLDRIEKISPFQQRCYEVVLRDGTRIRISDAYKARVRDFFRAALGPVQVELRRAASVGSRE